MEWQAKPKSGTTDFVWRLRHNTAVKRNPRNIRILTAGKVPGTIIFSALTTPKYPLRPRVGLKGCVGCGGCVEAPRRSARFREPCAPAREARTWGGGQFLLAKTGECPARTREARTARHGRAPPWTGQLGRRASRLLICPPAPLHAYSCLNRHPHHRKGLGTGARFLKRGYARRPVSPVTDCRGSFFRNWIAFQPQCARRAASFYWSKLAPTEFAYLRRITRVRSTQGRGPTVFKRAKNGDRSSFPPATRARGHSHRCPDFPCPRGGAPSRASIKYQK